MHMRVGACLRTGESEVKMSKIDSTGTSRPNPLVWILGRNHPGADKSFMWRDKLPNLSDPGVLVVDMTTLDAVTLSQIKGRTRGAVHVAIRDKLLGQGTVVVITARRFWIKDDDNGLTNSPHNLSSPRLTNMHRYSNYHILPVNLKINDVEDGQVINGSADHSFKAYIDTIKKFSFYLDDTYSFMHTPSSKGLYNTYKLMKVEGQDVTDNSGHYLGFTLIATKQTLSGSKLGEKGQLVLLPPSMDNPDAAIEKILSVYGKTSSADEAPPAWVSSLSFTKTDLLQGKISELEGVISKARKEINGLERRKGAILGHRRLLYTKGAELEAAVVNAFKSLGFPDAEQAGGSDRADCILDINTDNHQYGLVEVKGADGRTKERDIAQCIKWVDKMYGEGEKWPKPIFVPNQYRLEEYPQSRKDRITFEQREIDYAVKRGVCIIPACILYEAVKKAIDEEAPGKAKVAEGIASTDGVLESVF